jgi:hypothetical protein
MFMALKSLLVTANRLVGDRCTEIRKHDLRQ